MSKTWKWILGIVLGLIVLAGIGFAAAYFFGFGHMAIRVGPAFAGRRMMDGYGFGDRGFRGPMMGGRGFYPLGGFFLLGGLLRLILPLAVLALVAYFSYRMGKNAGSHEVRAVQAAPEPEPALEAEPEEPKKGRGRKVA